MAKNKLKTNKSAAKRFKVTASGKVRFRRATRAHHINKKGTTKHARQGRTNGVMKDCDAPGVLRLLAGS